MRDHRTAAKPGPEVAVTLVTGLEGAVDPEEPVTCCYCGNGIVSDDDHSRTCPWKAGAR
ncbi:hypothetical protein [Streptomyces sp. 8K308]|uniref:hypothetical protein n=1 Tax=Streptomyces sp. 8K308 TaxID=2530388 RepID=UPI0014047668|nr:hypothetical protein [Streptomyces sp. 8K308]